MKKYSTKRKLRTGLPNLFLCLALLLASVAMPAFGQGVLSGSQTGVVQEGPGLDIDQVMISGVVYQFDFDNSVVTLQGEEISRADLAEGMVVRFTADGNTLMQVQVLGPNNIIEGLNEH